ncbi:MAG: alanine racemase [Oscillospiraceae bacterium]|nr:alanine racemase [Oscillospiraceae bacterium]
MELHQRTAAIIHLDRLAANIENIRRRLKPGVELMAVVKGDGYGHGIPGILPTLQRCGVKRFAAAIWEEGVSLRQSGAETEPILILGDTREEQYPELIRYRLTPTIFSLAAAEKLNELAREANVVQPVHIKLDTGMRRIGFVPSAEAIEDICAIAALPNVEITGMFTHFARADELDRPETERQFDLFCRTVEALKTRGVSIPFIHTANSPSILLRPDVQLNAVRAGDVLYGLCPVDEDIWPEQGLQEVLTWETYVVLVKEVPAGAQIGYGGTCVTRRPTTVATIPIGFADGYDRHLSNRGAVVIRGKEAPILGRVCMDQFMVDVTDIPGVTRGDTVTLLGEGMSILRMANLLDQNVDEVVCHISKRVPRIYVEQ